MFGKLKDKLKKWVGNVADSSEDLSEELFEEISLKEERESKKDSKEKESGRDKVSKKRSKKKQVIGGDIDKKLCEEIETGNYLEPEKRFNVGTESFEPDLEVLDSKKKSFFKKVVKGHKVISEEAFLKYSEDLEMILLENNVALEVAEKMISDLKEKIVGEEFSKKEIGGKIISYLKKIILDVLVEPFDLEEEILKKNEPYVILFCGINGAGKTTHVAKIANFLKEKGFSCVLAAGDTFRAAAVEQLKAHGEKLDLKVIAHDYGGDPAAVGFDAVKYAKKNKIDVVLIDTAGRIHTATNLLSEMKKIKKVCSPDRTIFVGESITGNDSTDQVRAFEENIGIDGIILSKADIDDKGGTALSVGHTTGKPILFLGTGQGYEDIEKFDKNNFVDRLGLKDE